MEAPGRKRRKAIDVLGHAHELTFSVYRRQKVLLLPGIPELILEHLDSTRLQLNFQLWAFVVMPEHIHLLIHPQEDSPPISAVLKQIKGPLAKSIFAHHPTLRPNFRLPNGNECRFWQAGGGYDRNIFSIEAAWNSIRYIHHNPVKRGLCEQSTDWRWSSSPAYHEQASAIFVDLCPWRE